jgi:hypothetical protein
MALSLSVSFFQITATFECVLPNVSMVFAIIANALSSFPSPTPTPVKVGNLLEPCDEKAQKGFASQSRYAEESACSKETLWAWAFLWLRCADDTAIAVRAAAHAPHGEPSESVQLRRVQACAVRFFLTRACPAHFEIFCLRRQTRASHDVFYSHASPPLSSQFARGPNQCSDPHPRSTVDSRRMSEALVQKNQVWRCCLLV